MATPLCQRCEGVQFPCINSRPPALHRRGPGKEDGHERDGRLSLIPLVILVTIAVFAFEGITGKRL